MRLAEWIKSKDIQRSAVADALKVSPAYVTMLCSDVPNWPGRDLILRIREVTGGAVTADDFLPPETAAAPDHGEAA